MSPQEPQVLTEDIRGLLLRAIRPDEPDYGEAVTLLAEKASTSTRTVYRILGSKYASVMDLGLADRLAIAAGGHLSTCRIQEPDGEVLHYLS